MDLAQECAAEAAELTVPGLLRRNAETYPDHPALTAGEETLTWAELRTSAAEVARGLGALGIAPGQRLLIMMTSRFEHWIADLAAAHVRAISCTAYHTLSPDQITYVATHSGATVVVLEGADELARWAPALAASSTIRHVVVVDDVPLPDDPRFVRWPELRARGARLHRQDPAVVEKLTDDVVATEPVAMMYTSGTTGDPKAVVLSHYNVLYEAVSLNRVAPMDLHAPTIAYLPLAHVAERELAIYRALYQASHVFICADPGQIVSTLASVRPPSFFGVPRVWEKIASALRSVADGAAGLVSQLGLDALNWPASGSAPLPGPVREFLGGLGIEVLEVWGMSETTGCATANTPGAAKAGTVGKPLPGVEVRIAEDGEILVRGPIVFLGYLQPDGTVRDDTDDEGWLATGDIGALDEDGFLTITDRKKELIITSSGKNVAPTKIEGLLRAHPLVGYAIALGDQRPYLTALVTLDEETAPAWAAARGITGTLTYLAGHPAVRAELDALIEEVNGQLARAEQIKRYAVLPEPWTADSGELTPTLKLRRRIIRDRFAPDITSLYS